MNKPTLQAVDQEYQTNTPAPNPFDPANLGLDQSYTETVGVKKLITTIPVKKPNKQTFFRIHPGVERRDNSGVRPAIPNEDAISTTTAASKAVTAASTSAIELLKAAS